MTDTHRFFKVYSNLPLNVRKEVVLVIDGRPITWDVTYNEVANKTKTADAIVKKLAQLGVI